MVILDIGSCHEGDRSKAITAILRAKEIGADAIKFQLFDQDGEGQNVALNPEWMQRLVDWGDRHEIVVFASVFDVKFVPVVCGAGCEYIKVAYSQRNNKPLVDACVEQFGAENTFVSYGAMEIPRPNVKALYVHTVAGDVIYPVETYLSFGGIFRDGRFCGFSDHTLGYMQAATAVSAGASVIEKHVKFASTPLSVPDARFAITFEEAGNMIQLIKSKEVP